MLDLIIPILFVVVLFASKQVVNKVLPPHAESVPFPEREVFPEIETDDFLNIDKEEESIRRQRMPRRTSKETLSGRSNNLVRQSSSAAGSISSAERTSSVRSEVASSRKGRSEIAKMLRTSNGARRAFICSELFNRKYE